MGSENFKKIKSVKGIIPGAILIISIWSCESRNEKLSSPSYSIQTENVKLVLSTSDSLLAESFSWAAKQAMFYTHDASDPVGLWYEAALPQREAFCMRDVSHQSTGALLLGLAGHNKNMLYKFAENISESKDWCSYWEINRYDKPAPVDYRNDKEFWYNLPANYDVVDACFRQYLWTGDADYIQNPIFANFYQRSMEDYTKRWQLGLDEIMQRNRWANTPQPLDSNDYFHICRGLPSYEEGDPFQLEVGADLLGYQYKASLAWANILELANNIQKAEEERTKAALLKNYFLNNWQNRESKLSYQASFRDKGFVAKPSQFLLYTGIAHSEENYAKEIDALLNFGKINIESQSYLPLILSLYDQNQAAYNHILDLSHPNKKRREYPEVSFAVIESIVVGLAGVDADARYKQVKTLNRLPGKSQQISLEHIPIFNGEIDVSHLSPTISIFTNNTGKKVIWKPQFYGEYEFVFVNGKKVEAINGLSLGGKKVSFINLEVENNEVIKASLSK
jgi:hypothetical protein